MSETVSQFEFPGVYKSDVENARIASEFQLAAYKRNRAVRQRLASRIEEAGGKLLVFEEGSAFGFVALSKDDQMVIAVAGTDDADDAVHDLDLASMSVKEWGDMNGIETTADAYRVRTTAGFASATKQAWDGIHDALEDGRIFLKDCRSITLIGHSLGGAICCLLQMVVPFGGAQAILFGAPKVWRRAGRAPERNRLSIRKYHDSVTYIPPVCKHGSARELIVRRAGSYRSTVPLMYKPVIFVLVVATWLLGVAGTVASKFGFSSRFRVASGHSAEKYYEDFR